MFSQKEIIGPGQDLDFSLPTTLLQDPLKLDVLYSPSKK